MLNSTACVIPISSRDTSIGEWLVGGGPR